MATSTGGAQSTGGTGSGGEVSVGGASSSMGGATADSTSAGNAAGAAGAPGGEAGASGEAGATNDAGGTGAVGGTSGDPEPELVICDRSYTVEAGPSFEELVADQCNVITGELEIRDGLADLTGLETLIRVDGDLWGRGVFDLMSLKGLENLVSVGGMLRFDQTQLVDLSAIVSLEVVEGQLGFFSNLDMLRLGLPALREVGDLLLLNNNLVELDLPSIERVGGAGFSDNYYLADVSSLAQVQELGNFMLANNSIEELPVFSNITEMGTLAVRAEPLNSLEGLEHLTSIGAITLQELEIANLQGLENLTAIRGNLSLLRNDNLTSLDALGAVESIDGVLYIQDNPNLKNCEATALAARFGTTCGCTDNGTGSCL